MLSVLKEYQDIFAWPYKDLRGVDPEICQYTIHMRDDAKPSMQYQEMMDGWMEFTSASQYNQSIIAQMHL
ncbi:hypothetical protein DD606_25410 [Enterobacter cloacae complex sp. GF14B]|nr:hypothetical protein DD606_25410 [Enterobacter cloacae complex sp. GF14B]